MGPWFPPARCWDNVGCLCAPRHVVCIQVYWIPFPNCHNNLAYNRPRGYRLFLKPYKLLSEKRNNVSCTSEHLIRAMKKHYNLKNKKEGRVCHLGVSSRRIMFQTHYTCRDAIPSDVSWLLPCPILYLPCHDQSFDNVPCEIETDNWCFQTNYAETDKTITRTTASFSASWGSIEDTTNADRVSRRHGTEGFKGGPKLSNHFAVNL